MCGAQSCHKVGEYNPWIRHDDYEDLSWWDFESRHNYTAYLCDACFKKVMFGGKGDQND